MKRRKPRTRIAACLFAPLPTERGKRVWTLAFPLFIVFLALGDALPARADLVFNLTFDPSVASAPIGFTSAFDDAAAFYEAAYDDPVTINLHIGWGEINGNSLNSGELGQSLTNQQGFYSYSQVKTALENDSKSAADATAIADLPGTDPTGGAKFVMSNAEAKALDLLAGNAPGIDGWVGFDSAASYTFDPGDRAVPGEYDFIGVAEHEISEVMGRYGLGQNGAASGRYSPLDLFRDASPGVLDLVPESGASFSIDDGHTVINTFNGADGGDLSDWSGATLDSFNAFLTSGKELDVSAGDITEMDVIGYDRATTVPEPPGIVFLLGASLAIAVFELRRKVLAIR